MQPSHLGTRGLKHVFNFSPDACRQGLCVTFGRAERIDLRIGVDPERRCLVLNQSNAGVDGIEQTVPLGDISPSEGVEVALWLENDMAALQVGEGLPVSLRRFRSALNNRDLRVPAGISHRREHAPPNIPAEQPSAAEPPLADRAPPPAAEPHGPAADVSVVVPNYNYARFLEERLKSIFHQALAPREILVLDDASEDESLRIALDCAHDARREIELVCGVVNSASVFRQWRKAASLARGSFLWIAEADDLSESPFLKRCVDLLQADPSMVFAFTDSYEVNDQGERTKPSFKDYYAALGDTGLGADNVFDAAGFTRRFLAPRNLVLNASAVVWRTSLLRAAFERLGDDILTYRCAGDWRVYLEACLPGGTVGYVAEPLNGFRRHGNSVIHTVNKQAHFSEVGRIHSRIREICDEDPQMDLALNQYVTELARVWHIE